MIARACLVLAVLPRLAAADTVPLSSLPQTARVDTGAQLKLPDGVELTKDGFATTARGCLVGLPEEGWSSGKEELGNSWPATTSSSSGPFGLERLELRGREMVLERTVLAPQDGKLVATERGRIALRAVAQAGDGVTVYAFRRGKMVYLVALSGDSAFARIDTELSDSVTRGTQCPLAMTQLRVVRGSSQAVQIHMPAPGHPAASVVVDASISKTRRDPEPLLAVSARRF